ncbi:MAG: hypothetical protein WCQ26_02645 [Pseudanabaena sp. ELA748]
MKRAKSQEQKPVFASFAVLPNPALKGTRGYALVFFPLLRPPAPLSSGVIPNRKARQSYLFIAEVKRSKMICFVDEFREIIGDHKDK